MRIATVVLVLLMATVAGAVDEPGFFELTRAAGNAWVELAKDSKHGEVDSEIKLAEALAWEVLGGGEKVWVGDVVVSELNGVIFGGGLSVSVKKLAEKHEWGYRPEAEAYVGVDLGYRHDDRCLLGGGYVSMKF